MSEVQDIESTVADVTPETVQAQFSAADGTYRFARWQRPIAPVVFGVNDASLSVIKGAIEAVVTLAGHQTSETDPELGANLMIFFLRDWQELADVPDLDRLIPDVAQLGERLAAQDANQYRQFRFEDNGAIQACFSFIRIGGALADTPASDIALGEAVQMILLWGDGVFSSQSPLALLPDNKGAVLRPEIAQMIRAAYDPVMPVSANDASHALRLFARIGTDK